jgi:hypothetical protein
MDRVHMAITVWDYDKMSKNDFIGEVKPLDESNPN